jgi:hypothetical protein
MALSRNSTPAFLRRASFILGVALCTMVFAASPPVRRPDLAQVGKPDEAEAARLLEQFRGAGIPGEYYLDFALHALPRRGEERVYQGRLWGGRNEDGAITRVELTDGDGVKHRLLVQNGERAAVWRLIDGKPVQLGVSQLFEPLIPGVEVTAFDLQMPFLYWPEATLERISRIRGRPAHAFLFRAPTAFADQSADIVAARAYLDTQFNALMQTELIGNTGRVAKTFSLLSLKTADRQPLPKSADYRNEITRDKTRLVVNGAALNITTPSAVFDPSGLALEIAPPPNVVRL